MDAERIPAAAVPYILFQRTAYLRIPKSSVYRVIKRLSPVSFLKPVVALEARLRGEAIRRMYVEEMRAEYEQLRPFLPATCTSILDIGCGIAGIDVFLAMHYNAEPMVHLLDRSAVEKTIFYDFKPRGAFYNSLALAEQVLVSHGIAGPNIRLYEVDEQNGLSVPGPIDLVISLYSWGFHYPLATYLEQVHSVLAETGTLIVDVRDATGGLGMLQEAFETVEVAVAHPKSKRVIARGPLKIRDEAESRRGRGEIVSGGASGGGRGGAESLAR